MGFLGSTCTALPGLLPQRHRQRAHARSLLHHDIGSQLHLNAKFESGPSYFSFTRCNRALPARGRSTRGQPGVNLGSTQGQPGVNLGSTWGQPGVNPGTTRGQPGVNLGSTWGQSGDNLGSTWGQRGVNLGSTWGQPGDKLGSTWGQPGDNPGSTWGQPGVNLGSNCVALPRTRPPRCGAR